MADQRNNILFQIIIKLIIMIFLEREREREREREERERKNLSWTLHCPTSFCNTCINNQFQCIFAYKSVVKIFTWFLEK